MSNKHKNNLEKSFEIKCIICGKSALKSAKTVKYCSLECEKIAKPCKTKINIICDYCKKEYLKYRADVKNNLNNFCSNNCRKLFRNNRIVRTCKTCRQEYKCFPSINKEFCSELCLFQWRRGENPALILEDYDSLYQKFYRDANKEKLDLGHLERTRKRRALIKEFNLNNVENYFTTNDWEEIKVHYNHTCLKCFMYEPLIKLVPDHIVPLSKNGDNTKENIQPLCEHCNLVKGTKIIDYR